MRTIIISILLCLAPMYVLAETVTFSGAKLPVQQVTPERNTGIDLIFVTYDTDGLAMTYHANTSSPVVVYRYSSLGGGYAEQVTGVEASGSDYTINNPQGDMGYIFEEGTDRYYCWLTDYSAHRLTLTGCTVPEEQDCNMTNLSLQGSGSPIHFYTINGRQCTLDQQIEVEYYTLEYDEESRQYNQVTATHNLESFAENVYISPAPLCNTTFRISGDRFLRAWNWLQHTESEQFIANAVEVHTYAEQTPRSDDPDFKSNEMGSTTDTGELGGSAPAEILFSSVGSDAVIHHEWQFASDPNYEKLIYRFNERDVTYTFREEGTTYVRYIGSNASGTCETEGDTYTVTIGTSDIKCPNAFSPGASEGVNDEWKVSYRSIIDFECWIFNRHGRQLYHFNDPAQGWDGKINGKVVKTGVYYYVIEATGADGRKYKLSGDINVIGYKRSGSSTSTTDADPETE